MLSLNRRRFLSLPIMRGDPAFSDRQPVGSYVEPLEPSDRSVADRFILERLYNSYFRKLAESLRAAYGPGPPDPEEVAQLAFESMAKRGKLEELESPENYAWICARNIIIAHKRAEARHDANSEDVKQRFYGDQSYELDPERVLTAKEELDIAMQTIANLPERRRQLLLLCRVEGLTPTEAARRVGISRTAAVRHIANAVQAIQEAIHAPKDKGGRS